jgi:hypothetical protein
MQRFLRRRDGVICACRFTVTLLRGYSSQLRGRRRRPLGKTLAGYFQDAPVNLDLVGIDLQNLFQLGDCLLGQVVT